MLGRLTRTPWWVWSLLLTVAVVMLVLGMGWFPLFVVVAGWAMTVIARNEMGQAVPGDTAEIVGQPQHATELTVARASNEQLCELWTHSGQELRRAYLPATIVSHAALRQAVLDEMQRRDPEGFDRWLADRPDQRDPGAYLSSR